MIRWIRLLEWTLLLVCFLPVCLHLRIFLWKKIVHVGEQFQRRNLRIGLSILGINMNILWIVILPLVGFLKWVSSKYVHLKLEFAPIHVRHHLRLPYKKNMAKRKAFPLM